MPAEERTRRGFLRAGIAAAVAAGLAGCRSDGEETVEPTPPETETPTDPAPTETEPSTPTPSPSPTPVPEIVERYGERYDSIVNVAQAASGDSSVGEVVAEGINTDDTLLYFPTGEYELPELRVRDVRNVGLASLPRDDAVIRPAVPRDDFREAFIDFRDVSDVLLEGITFDYTEPGYGGSLRLVTHGNFIARDLRTKGKLPDTDKSRKHVAYRFDVQDEEGIGLVERIVARDGGHDGGNGVGIFVGKDHAGTVTFRDCEVANFPNNGLYASAPGADYDGYRGANGAVHVRGGRYENNNIANIRIGSTGSTVRHATVVVDKVPPTISESDLNVRGIRLRARNGQVVEDCDIRIGEDAGEGFGAISYHPDHGSSTIKNTRIQVDRDDFSAIDATHANGGGTEAPLTFENVTITGKAAEGATVDIADRHGTTFRNCKIEQTGADREGIVFTNSEDCLVANSTIRVTGDPIELNDSTVDRKALTLGTPSVPDGPEPGASSGGQTDT
ncbi:right-handed parallel beta-helix repeat-containing protein [Halosimplex aquaticum]|uniref:Right-handed parallel beta-helix repeat-containing protein n=1 Tax=Halosimplex aquaticum TaxID=3026162 RepID=A0ABD5XY19_9EURY|nr:right-handed parallel beta-helix repeat-containing protein [Halosimplex aquaticum]